MLNIILIKLGKSNKKSIFATDFKKNTNLMRKIFLWLFLCGVTMLFGQEPYIVDTEGIGKYGYLDKNATTYIRLNTSTYSNVYQLFARTWTGTSSQLTYGTPFSSCAAANSVQNTTDYGFVSGMSVGSIAYTSVHADICGGGNSYGGNPHNTGFNEKQHYIFELTTRNSDLSSSIIVGNKNVVMSAKIDFGSLNDRKLQRFWIKNNGTFAEATEIANDGFKIYYEPATGSETFDGSESNVTIYGNYAGNPTNNNEYGHDALNIDIPAGGLRVYVVLETLATCSPGKTVSVNLLNDGLSFSPVPTSNNKTLARVNALPATPTAITYNYQTTSITPTSQTVELYAAVTDLSVSVAGATSYQWYRNTLANNYGGTAISGAMSSTYEPPTGPSTAFNNPATNYYYAIATTGATSCDKVVSSVSAVTVNSSSTADWANIQAPKVHQDLYVGIGIDVFAQVYFKGTTPGTGTPGIGQAPGVQAWIGYSLTNNNPNQSNWTWLPAVYNANQSSREDYNDEYWIKDFGKDLPAGTYYVASRFQKDGGAPVYGGIDGTTSNESGGIYDGATYFNLKLENTQTITWTGTAWNNTSGPKITSPAVIAGDATSPPSFSAKNLTINNGVGLTIPSGQSVTVENELINNNGTSSTKTLVVESGANFIQNNGSASNTGIIQVKRNASVANDQYNFWSSPVSGQNLYTFYENGSVTANRVYTYNTLTDYYNVVASGTFAKGIGYSIKGGAGGSSNASFLGVPNNGDAPVPLASTGRRFNLIGNPYASNIDAGKFYAENQTQIENTLYFWDNTGNTVLNQMGAGYTGYTSNNFATYNIDAAIGNPGTGSPNDESKTPSGKIVVGQGFIVRAKSGVTSPTVNFKNAMRTADAGVFFAKQNQDKNAFWLQLVAPSQLSNTTAVIYRADAQNILDKFDSELSSSSSDALYSFAENDAAKLSIQGRNEAQLNNDVMRLGVKFYKNGVYTIAIKDKQGIFANGQSIYLHDKTLDVFTDLQTAGYSFSANAGMDESRFEIVYKENTVLGNAETKTSDFQIYKDGESFVVQSSKNLGRIEVYSMAGQLFREFVTSNQSFKISVSDLPAGVYLVKAENAGDIRTKKIIK